MSIKVRLKLAIEWPHRTTIQWDTGAKTYHKLTCTTEENLSVVLLTGNSVIAEVIAYITLLFLELVEATQQWTDGLLLINTSYKPDNGHTHLSPVRVIIIVTNQLFIALLSSQSTTNCHPHYTIHTIANLKELLY